MANPYDTVETILNAARVRLNDAIQTLAGDVLTDTQPFTLQVVNNAWRRLQEFLLSAGFSGFSRLKESTVLSNVSTSTTTLSWTSSPALPQDFIAPLILWERPNGTTNFYKMDQCLNGLPSVATKQARNLLWEWVHDEINIPGATVAVDFQIRYLAFLADFTSLSGGGSAQPVPIMRCLDSFADFICAEMAKSRGDIDGQQFVDSAQAKALMIYSRDTNQPNAIYKPSEYNKMPDPYTPGKAAA